MAGAEEVVQEMGMETLRRDFMRVSSKKPTLPRLFLKFLASPGFRAVMLYRAGAWCHRHGRYRLAGILERLMFHTCHCEIKARAKIGPGLMIAHPSGLVVGGGTRIGKNCDLRQNVTLGGNFRKMDEGGRTQPWLEDNISLAVGAVIAGPVRIGSNVIVGANTVVTRDIPANSIVRMDSKLVIRPRWTEESGRGL